ncbi:hypothetical protein [Rhodococcus sp. BH4]|uniref:cucumopine synthase-related protein n=1 Tax=Rhodococcus sp. BH4 TaxID=1807790 RepID=UPI0012EB805A|nr:hypothetical protein [Rhodococcus sp. BH4]
MAPNEFDTLRHEINAASLDLLKAEPAEIKSIRTGAQNKRAGAGAQYYVTNWNTAHGMLRDWACFGLYPLLRLAESNDTDLKPSQLLEVWQATSFKYSAFLGYSGFATLHDFERRAHALCTAQPDRDHIIPVLRELVRYANLLTAWSHHYFPWGDVAGARSSVAETADNLSAAVLAPSNAPAAQVTPDVEGPRVEITWEQLDIRAEAVLAASLNPELVAEFVSALPFTILQEHAISIGESMYGWTPLVSTAPIHYTERICDAPVGRLRFSQSTGQKFVIQYGTTTEDLNAPVLGQILPEHCAGLTTVGESAWRNTLDRREDIWMTIQLL